MVNAGYKKHQQRVEEAYAGKGHGETMQCWTGSHSLVSKPTLQAEADAMLTDTGQSGLSWPLTHFIFGTGLMVMAFLPSLRLDGEGLSWLPQWQGSGICC